MSLEIVTRMMAPAHNKASGSILVLEIAGNLTLGEGCQKFRRYVRECASRGSLWVVLNLADTYRVDSAGIAELVSALGVMRAGGGSLALAEPLPNVRQVLELTRLDSIFEVYETVARATQDFSELVESGV